MTDGFTNTHLERLSKKINDTTKRILELQSELSQLETDRAQLIKLQYEVSIGKIEIADYDRVMEGLGIK